MREPEANRLCLEIPQQGAAMATLALLDSVANMSSVDTVRVEPAIQCFKSHWTRPTRRYAIFNVLELEPAPGKDRALGSAPSIP